MSANREHLAIERNADLMDTASLAESISTACAIADTQAKSQPEKFYSDEGKMVVQGQNEQGEWAIPDCITCGEEIVEGRLKLGRMRCVDCQTKLERKQKGY